MSFETWAAPDYRLSMDNVALWNAAMSHAGRTIPLGDGATGFTFTPLDSAPATPSVRKLFLEEKGFGYVRIDSFPFQSFCGVSLDVADLDDVPPELGDALTEGMLMTVLSALPEDFRTRLRLGPAIGTSSLTSHADTKDLQWFSCGLAGVADEPILFSFAAPPDTLCAELAGFTPSALQVRSTLGQLVPIEARRLLGTAKLSFAELYALAPGDCILFSQAGSQAHRIVLVDRRVYVFSQEEAGWVCVQVLPFDRLVEIQQTGTHDMEDAPLTSPDDSNRETAGDEETVRDVASNPPEASGPLDVPAPLEVTVTFGLGSTRLPIGEIETWQTGAVVALPEELSGDDIEVTVSANGRTVAQGDLVRIDDRLAVRLSRVLVNAPKSNG